MGKPRIQKHACCKYFNLIRVLLLTRNHFIYPTIMIYLVKQKMYELRMKNYENDLGLQYWTFYQNSLLDFLTPLFVVAVVILMEDRRRLLEQRTSGTGSRLRILSESRHKPSVTTFDYTPSPVRGRMEDESPLSPPTRCPLWSLVSSILLLTVDGLSLVRVRTPVLWFK